MVRRHASVVIGAAFGDEGKGLMTDFLAHEPGSTTSETTVVRFNGGAQAGHTVVTPDGRRHVFHHFGSGTLAGAATHLSRFFVVNPILFLKERGALGVLGANLNVSAAPEAIVTTPWDMMINTSIETARGAARHGSCGLGIGETVGRNEETPWKLTVADLRSADLRDRLIAIRDQWVPGRAGTLGLTIPAKLQDIMHSDGLFDAFLRDVRHFLELVPTLSVAEATANRRVIFEGAQGLLLDQSAGPEWFPYVTRSNTGLTNVLPLAQEAGIGALSVYYMTRTYLTRHGAGPLPYELPEPPFPAVVDPTNVPNTWQGTLRYAPFNIDLLASSIRRDLDAAVGKIEGLKIVPKLGVTWVDQAPRELPVIFKCEKQTLGIHAAIGALRRELPYEIEYVWLSRGPTRETMTIAGGKPVMYASTSQTRAKVAPAY